jgi:hypothetical protein
MRIEEYSLLNYWESHDESDLNSVNSYCQRRTEAQEEDWGTHQTKEVSSSLKEEKRDAGKKLKESTTVSPLDLSLFKASGNSCPILKTFFKALALKQ